MTAETAAGASVRMRCSTPLHETLIERSVPSAPTSASMRPEVKDTFCVLMPGAMAAESAAIPSSSSVSEYDRPFSVSVQAAVPFISSSQLRSMSCAESTRSAVSSLLPLSSQMTPSEK